MVDYVLLYNVYGICCGLFATLISLLNTLVILVFIYIYHKQNGVKKTNFIFCFQAMTDIMAAVTLVIETKIYMANDEPREHLTVREFFVKYSCFLCVCTLFCITMDRYCAVNHPFIHRKHMTLQFISIVVFCVFLLPCVPATVYAVYIGRLSSTEFYWNRMIYFVVIGAITITMLVTVYVLLVKAHGTIKGNIQSRIRDLSDRSINSFKSRNTSQKENRFKSRIEHERRKEKRVLVILLAMVSTYTFTYLPLAVWNIYLTFIFMTGTKDVDFVHYAIDRCFALLYCTSTIVNPLITLCYKDDFKSVSTKLFRRKDSEEEAMRLKLEKQISTSSYLQEQDTAM